MIEKEKEVVRFAEVAMARNDYSIPDNATSFKAKPYVEHIAAAAAMKRDETVMIELCTDANSSIYFASVEKDLLTMQVTKEEDMLNPQTKEQLIHVIKKYANVAL